MVNAYINYPNPHITVHGDATCSAIGKMRKGGQRRVRIDAASISQELKQFATKAYVFGADASKNDMWLEIDFGDASFERAVVEHVRRLLGVHYKPLGAASIENHCS